VRPGVSSFATASKTEGTISARFCLQAHSQKPTVPDCERQVFTPVCSVQQAGGVDGDEVGTDRRKIFALGVRRSDERVIRRPGAADCCALDHLLTHERAASDVASELNLGDRGRGEVKRSEFGATTRNTRDNDGKLREGFNLEGTFIKVFKGIKGGEVVPDRECLASLDGRVGRVPKTVHIELEPDAGKSGLLAALADFERLGRASIVEDSAVVDNRDVFIANISDRSENLEVIY